MKKAKKLLTALIVASMAFSMFAVQSFANDIQDVIVNENKIVEEVKEEVKEEIVDKALLRNKSTDKPNIVNPVENLKFNLEIYVEGNAVEDASKYGYIGYVELPDMMITADIIAGMNDDVDIVLSELPTGYKVKSSTIPTTPTKINEKRLYIVHIGKLVTTEYELKIFIDGVQYSDGSHGLFGNVNEDMMITADMISGMNDDVTKALATAPTGYEVKSSTIPTTSSLLNDSRVYIAHIGPVAVTPPVTSPITPPTTGGTGVTGNGDLNFEDTVEIIDEETPLANLPLPEDIVEIIDEKAPLGNLPKSGTATAGFVASIGLLSLVGSLVLVLKLKKKEK